MGKKYNSREIDYDKLKKMKKNIVPLERIDHGEINYMEFEKDFYEEH